MAKKKKGEPRDWTVVSTIKYDGEFYEPGETIALSEEEAAAIPHAVKEQAAAKSAPKGKKQPAAAADASADNDENKE